MNIRTNSNDLKRASMEMQSLESGEMYFDISKIHFHSQQNALLFQQETESLAKLVFTYKKTNYELRPEIKLKDYQHIQRVIFNIKSMLSRHDLFSGDIDDFSKQIFLTKKEVFDINHELIFGNEKIKFLLATFNNILRRAIIDYDGQNSELRLSEDLNDQKQFRRDMKARLHRLDNYLKKPETFKRAHLQILKLRLQEVMDNLEPGNNYNNNLNEIKHKLDTAIKSHEKHLPRTQKNKLLVRPQMLEKRMVGEKVPKYFTRRSLEEKRKLENKISAPIAKRSNAFINFYRILMRILDRIRHKSPKKIFKKIKSFGSSQNIVKSLGKKSADRSFRMADELNSRVKSSQPLSPRNIKVEVDENLRLPNQVNEEEVYQAPRSKLTPKVRK